MTLERFHPLRFLPRYGFRFGLLAVALVSLLVQPVAAQNLSASRQIHLRVRDARGAPLASPVPVTLRARVGNFNFTAYTQQDGSLVLRNLTADDYLIQIEMPGYVPVVEEVNVPLQYPNYIPQVYVYLQTESDGDSTASPYKPLGKESKGQKEIKKAREKLESNDLKSAQKNLERAQKAAPNHPEVHYLFGMLYLRQKALPAAREHLEKAIELYPQHVPALRALGRLLYQQGDLAGTIQRLEQALTVIGSSADDHMLLAQALLEHSEFEKAVFHARQAAEVDPALQPQMRLIVCRVLLAQENYPEAEHALEEYLRDFPNHEDAATAREVLQSIRNARAAGGARRGAGETLRPSKSAQVPLTAIETTPDVEWAPPDVDTSPPAVLYDVPCQLADVVARARVRFEDMASNLGNVNAEETVTHVDINKHGQPTGTETGRFDYDVSLRTAPDGTLSVKEMRNGVFGVEVLRGFATNAIVVMAMVFHPYYASDFELQCEGQGIWQGQPVWFVHFRQRDDRPARIHSFRSNAGTFQVPLKGRAWIAANSYEIVRLETNMVAPIPEAWLEREQMVIEYSPVHFQQRNQTFWLPSSADIYFQYRGKRWHRRHVLKNYIHFSVDTKQKIAAPDVPEPPPSPPQRYR